MAEFYVHTASVRPYRGMSGSRRNFDAAKTVPCFFEDVRKQITSSSGDVIVSTTTLYCDPAYLGYFPVDSEVTANAAGSTVVQVARHDSGDLDMPDHLEIYLS